MKEWTAKERQRLIELCRQGYNATEVAEQMGRSVHTVRHYVRKWFGLRKEPSNKTLRRLESKVRSLHEKGWLDTSIGLKLGVNRHVVCGWRARLSLPCNRISDRDPQHRRRVMLEKQQERRLRYLHGLGWTDGAIGDEMELDRQAVYQRRTKLGLPANYANPRDPRYRVRQLLKQNNAG